MERKLYYFYREMEFMGKSLRTIETYKFAMIKFKAFCRVNKIKYRELDQKQARAFRNFLAQDELKPNTINMCISALKTFYDYLVDEGIVNWNPVNTSKLRVKIADPLPGFLTEDEKSKVMTYFDSQPEHVRLGHNFYL